MDDSPEEEPSEEDLKLKEALDMCEASVEWAKTEIERLSAEVKANPEKKEEYRALFLHIARKLDVEKKILEKLK